MDAPDTTDRTQQPGAHRAGRVHWYWLFLLPPAGLLFPGLYAREAPVLFGFPFFYWYQFAWVLITAAITALVYLLTTD